MVNADADTRRCRVSARERERPLIYVAFYDAAPADLSRRYFSERDAYGILLIGSDKSARPDDKIESRETALTPVHTEIYALTWFILFLARELHR